jgi:hypothetical protein
MTRLRPIITAAIIEPLEADDSPLAILDEHDIVVGLLADGLFFGSSNQTLRVFPSRS